MSLSRGFSMVEKRRFVLKKVSVLNAIDQLTSSTAAIIIMMRSQQQHRARQSRKDQNLLFALQSDLLQIWTKLEVEEYYQNIVLAHLDTLPLTEAEERISKEIKDTYQGRSSYFKLTEQLKYRKQALSTLQTLINNNTNKPNVDSEQLASICQEISSLRDNNLGFAETLMHLLKKLALEDGNISDECMQMINNLDSDNRFLKESFLKDFILFHQGFDPFFSYHYDMKGKIQPNKYSPFIDQLFNLSLSYACRLFKAKNNLLDVMSRTKDLKTNRKQNQQTQTPMFVKKVSNNEGTPGQETTKGEKRKTSFNFRRKNLSVRHSKEKERQAYETLQMRSLHISRKASSLHKQLKPLEEKPQRKLPFLQSLRHKKQKQFEQSFYRNDLKFQTEPDDDSDCKSLNKYRIKPVKHLKPSAEQSKRTIFTEEEEQISPQKKLSLRQKKTLHPLNKYKNLRTLQKQSEKEMSKTEVLKSSSDEKESSQFLSSVYSVPSKMKESKSMKQEADKAQIQNTSNPKKERRVLVDQKSTIKMKPGKFSHFELIKYLKTVNFKESYRILIIDLDWEEEIRIYQSYVSEYSLNDDLAIVAITLLLPDGNYQIKLWGLTQACSQHLSLSLFTKYLAYLEKTSTLTQVYYKGEPFNGLIESNFILREQKVYVRQRSSGMIEKKNELQQFLSLKCSNIVVPQSNSKSMFISEQIQSFSEENSFSFLPFTLINKKVMNQNLKMLVKVSENISDMATLNKLLEDQDLDTYEVNRNIKVSNIKALRLNLVNNFNVPFVTAEGYFRFQGSLIYNSYDSYVCQVTCAQFNTKVFFGKGFPSIDYFIQHRKVKKGKKYEAVDFSVKMFSKQLYGRIESQQNNEGCYAYWQINLSWEDELLGRTKHDMNNCISFGSEPFYVGIEIQSELIYCFQVHQKDFLL